MKRTLSILIVGILIFSLIGCSSQNTTESAIGETTTDISENDVSETTTDQNVTSIVVTTYAVFDWIQNIIQDTNDNYSVTVLNATDNVSYSTYEPSEADLDVIDQCDIFVYSGGESWVPDVISSLNCKKINLLDILGDSAKINEDTIDLSTVTFTDASQEYIDKFYEDGASNTIESEDRGIGTEDDHVWLSLKNAELFTQYISNEICNVNNVCADTIKENTASYIAQLQTLDEEYSSMVTTTKTRSVIVADSFPFRYLFEDYGITYYSPYTGSDIQSTTISNERTAAIAQKADEIGSNELIITESNDPLDATNILNVCALNGNSNLSLVQLDSMQTYIASDINNQISYLTIMNSNLVLLEDVLNS